MRMEVCLAQEQDKAGTLVKFVPVQMLEQRKTEIHNMIARRAYELFEYRGRVPSHEIDDWVQAESELVYPCCHDLKESADAIILHVDLPGSLTADQLTLSVEPRRLLLSGDKEISVLCGDASDTHWEVRWQQIFRVHDLPTDVDPSKATATLGGHAVDIVLPRASAANERGERARSASSGR
jgi:HSP20 family molecular chaperone IbpA